MSDQRFHFRPGGEPSATRCRAAGEASARAWLLLAVTALGVSALMAVLLVAARTPGLAGMLAGRIAFAEALVLHVNFSVLVWCLALAGVLWSWFAPKPGPTGAIPLGLAGGGALLMLLTPLATGPVRAVLSNYVPVLHQPAYLLGLGLFGAGAVAVALRFLWVGMVWRPPRSRREVLRLGLGCVALTLVAAALVTALAFLGLESGLPAALYYERLFWGGGHVLQLAYAQLMVVAWLWLARLGGLGWGLPVARMAGWLLAGMLPVALALVVALVEPVQGAGYRRAYTGLMILSGGWLLVPVVVLCAGWWRARPAPDAAGRVARSALGLSLGLGVLGGVLGGLIRDDSLLVPAHYHAITGAVTLALMGLVQGILPRLGGRPLGAGGMALQLRLYGGGVALMALGLAWSGGHGVTRKTPGEPASDAALGGMLMMGLGGLAAIAGVLMFVALMWLSLGARRSGRVREALPTPSSESSDGH